MKDLVRLILTLVGCWVALTLGLDLYSGWTWEVQGASVLLRSEGAGSVELRGTLSRDTVSGRYVLSQDGGTKYYVSQDQILMMSWPSRSEK
jgi:hypothetical protein